jgi:hypothetical protein
LVFLEGVLLISETIDVLGNIVVPTGHWWGMGTMLARDCFVVMSIPKLKRAENSGYILGIDCRGTRCAIPHDARTNMDSLSHR